ncbi:MAG: phosphatidylglycerophosphatase A [Alphaproteobacteria bacterium]|nr:phosphatidylglycerophosphatase A [Alphaproteobacteria bacterium]
MYKVLCYAVCSLGVGFAPKASGTFGSLVTLPMAFGLAYYWGFWGLLAGATAVFFIGTIATKEVLKYTKHDPSLVIIDEVAGQLVTFLPLGWFLLGNASAWWVYGLGFVLFRAFDIFKIGPVKWADEKLGNEWGVMLDDVFAGIFAAAVLFAVWFAVGLAVT